MSIDHRSNDDIPMNLSLTAITIGLAVRPFLKPYQVSDCFDPWWQTLIALNRGGGSISFDNLNEARRHMAVFCYTLAYDNPDFREIRIISEPMNYDLVEESNERSDVPNIDTDPIEGESEEDRLARLEQAYDEHREETYDKKQETNEEEEEDESNLFFELSAFAEQLKQIYKVISKVAKSKSKPSSKIYLWFLKATSAIEIDEFYGYSRLLVSQVYSKYEDIVASKSWNVDSLHKSIVSRVKTLEYRDFEDNEEWEKEMTKVVRSFRDELSA